MIKTDGKEIYISCGESCYYIPLDGVRAAYFGRRVEPEDDLSALYETDGREFFIADGEGKRINANFEFVSAVIEDKREFSFPSFDGDKTVKLSLEDKKLGIAVDLFYTPYTRGAISRRAVVKNIGGKKVTLRVPSASLCLDGEYVQERCDKAGINYIGLNGKTDAYGLLTIFGGKCDMSVTAAGGATDVAVAVDKAFTLAPGERAETPETLLVRSEYGMDGVMRALHDVLREYAVPHRFDDKRRKVALASDIVSTTSVDAAAELGADALVLPIEQISREVKEVAEACKKRGVLFGARVDLTGVDLADTEEVGAAYFKIHNIIEELGALYVAPIVENRDDYDGVLGLYALIKKIEKAHPEIIIEGTGDVALLCFTPIFGRTDTFDAFIKDGALFRVVPPSALACYVTSEGSLKNQFDLCSLGALGYLPTVGKSQNAFLAVRAQVFSYQDDSPLVLNGDFYLPSVADGDFALSVVSKDKSKAYAVYRYGGGDKLRFCGLDGRNLYRVRELDKIFSGAALSGVGVPIPKGLKTGDTLSFHLRQVADYEA